MQNALIAILSCLFALSAPLAACAGEETRSMSFDQQQWDTYTNREENAKFLVESKQLIGLTKVQVHRMLGVPLKATNSQEFFQLQREGPRDVSICSSNPGPAYAAIDRRPRENILPCLQLDYANDSVQKASVTTHKFGTPTLPEGAPIPDSN
jgi:hypothetical protein